MNKIHTHNIYSKEYNKQLLGLTKDDLLKIKEQLKANGITQEQVAKEADCSIAWVSEVLNANKGISNEGKHWAAQVVKAAQKLNRYYLESHSELLCEQVKNNKVSIKLIDKQQAKLNELLSRHKG